MNDWRQAPAGIERVEDEDVGREDGRDNQDQGEEKDKGHVSRKSTQGGIWRVMKFHVKQVRQYILDDTMLMLKHLMLVGGPWSDDCDSVTRIGPSRAIALWHSGEHWVVKHLQEKIVNCTYCAKYQVPSTKYSE